MREIRMQLNNSTEKKVDKPNYFSFVLSQRLGRNLHEQLEEKNTSSRMT
jgi:hypothetical protein